ncbi:hypothetical protein TNIN_299881 [Trichonephila inaurata madagascariensis]|uniref:Uncharacterized protein n=1 Tax=Trichonephila inaurata madagascariensis TaxID=2747483 RepID=A0A8X6XAX3_9ARAC|nr:hypothetical protein TNIN_299881 [Trichonephila inaurata madagascariensis]
MPRNQVIDAIVNGVEESTERTGPCFSQYCPYGESRPLVDYDTLPGQKRGPPSLKYERTLERFVSFNAFERTIYHLGDDRASVISFLRRENILISAKNFQVFTKDDS